MHIVIVNPPHTAIGSRIPDDHLPPLGLLAIAGPLIDDGHRVELLDAEFGPMSAAEITRSVVSADCDLLLLGHSGSTSAHPTAVEIATLVRRANPRIRIIYGGVFPTYHWREVLCDTPEFDVIVRGEGEETCRQLVLAVAAGTPLHRVNGLAFRHNGEIVSTPPQPVIRDLDAYRIAWELIDFRNYSYWGRKRAVVVQFSRGCPHPCTYCGQRGFWTQWRHRNPEKFAAEIAWLHRVHGVQVFNFADENPTSSKKMWKRFLEAIIAEGIDVTLVGSTRADDIVRDRDHLNLYRKAGIERFLMGMEHTDEEILRKVRKGGSTSIDRQAIDLMRRHGMLSMATWVVGFEEERDRDYWRVLRLLLSYDPDQIQSLYVTPHRWTPLFRDIRHRKVIQLDQRKWDYKHQVLATRHVPPWRVFLWVKLIEFVVQSRPKAIWRLLTFKDPKLRHAQRWYYQMGKRVWFHEVFGFLFRDNRTATGPTVAEFWGDSLENENSMARGPVEKPALKTKQAGPVRA
ncbi:magnesium-protoporphyrin IX monomethyl ester anaerobic oxidative cyclase [Roseibium sp.]|uniref:magnesium-protoporphyrin IX monomethyl ester anaerobic oxidative cyclase n=1 Tax=Roseibium sp. TaxID=1936156 RepID=UPI003BAB1A03